MRHSQRGQSICRIRKRSNKEEATLRDCGKYIKIVSILLLLNFSFFFVWIFSSSVLIAEIHPLKYEMREKMSHRII